ncbi:hypothetical protein SteCoe_29815 [Stentor coeruleus]|uniref:Uncharacterized protein n=1 Tax=Stentor coeruleus TaxID=5963 RepID=A0A1R2B5G2_9CILI|nr:hypothetical protein SteCoe_29815 [Stentor coeruleus]
MEKNFSIKDISLYDTEQKVSTPRSLEACKREGITAKDLVYKPLEYFKQIDLAPDIQSMYYEYFENKRRQLIKLVKSTRKKIIEEEQTNKSKSSSVLNDEMKISQQSDKSKNIQLKSVAKVLSNEALISREIELRHQEHMQLLMRNQEKTKEKALRSKELAEMQRVKEIEKQKALCKKLREEQKLLVNKIKNDLKNKSLESQIEENKQKEHESTMQQKNEKLKEHLEKAEEHLAKLREEREKKIKQKDLKEQKRQEKIRREVKTARIKIRAKSKKIEKKRIELIAKFEEEMERRKAFHDILMKEEEQRSVNIIEGQNEKLKEKHRAMSQERIKRSQMAKITSEEFIEKKRMKLQEKNEEIAKRMEENEEMKKQDAEMKKHRELIKQFNKEWNLMREKKKKEHEEKMIRRRIKRDNKKIEELARLKQKQLKLRKCVSQQELVRKEKIQDAFYQMSITKKWNKNILTRALNSPSDIESLYSGLNDDK